MAASNLVYCTDRRGKRPKLFTRNQRCFVCGRHFDAFTETTLEHLVPVAKGGGQEWNNLGLSHSACNSDRGSHTLMREIMQVRHGWPIVDFGSPAWQNDCSPEGYHDDHHAISQSMLKVFKRDRNEYFERFVAHTHREVKSTDGMELGSAAHEAILLPGGMTDLCVQIPPEVLTKDGKRRGAAWEQFQAENRDKILLKEAAYRQVLVIRDAVYANDKARRLLERSEREETHVWHDEELRDVVRRSRLDVHAKGWIADLKVTGTDVTPESFARQVLRFDYHCQAAYYRAAVRAKTGETLPFVFILVQDKWPHAVRLYDLSERVLSLAEESILKTLLELRNCYETKNWTDPRSQEIVTIDVPEYAYRDDYEIN